VLDAAAATTAKHPDRCTDHQHPHPDGALSMPGQDPSMAASYLDWYCSVAT
jgi:hypothetical protein